MSERVKDGIKKYMTLTGCFLINFCQCIFWYWGNLSIYMASYFRVKHDVKQKAISSWPLSIYFLTWNCLTLLVHFLTKKLGKRWIIFLGILATESGFILGWLGVLYPEIPLELGFGFMCGIGASFTTTVAILIAVEWVEEHTCFVTSCLQAGMSFGGIIINQAISWYINPDNMTPISVGQWTPFFNQEYINDRVPQYLVLFIVSTSLISLTGFCLIQKKSRMQFKPLANVASASKDDEKKPVIQKPKKDGKESFIEEQTQCTALSILRKRTFYVLAFCILNCDTASLTASTYYKEFGQTRINDDHFLTLVGTTPPVLNTILTVVYGLLIDRYGGKRPLIVMSAVLTISLAFLYVSPLGGKWVFFLICQFCLTLPNVFYNATVLALLKLFGEHQFAFKLTFLYSVSITSTLSLPPVAKALILSYGWFPLFTLPAVLSLVNFLLVVIVWK